MSKSLEALEIIDKDYALASKGNGDFIPSWLQDELVEPIKNKLEALEVIKELFGFDFAIRFGNNELMLMVTNKKTNEYWEMPLTQEEYDVLKKVLL